MNMDNIYIRLSPTSSFEYHVSVHIHEILKHF